MKEECEAKARELKTGMKKEVRGKDEMYGRMKGRKRTKRRKGRGIETRKERGKERHGG